MYNIFIKGLVMDKKQNILYVVFAYLFLWIVLLIAGIFIFVAEINIPMVIPTIIGSWTPTIALLVLFKKLLPNNSIKDFFKNVFKQSVNWKIVLIITVIQILIVVCSILITSFTKDIQFNNLVNISVSTILMGFVMSAITGATGEEAGWRGFLQPNIQKNNGVIKSSIFIGLIWGFWHTPLWFLEGMAGFELIQYILVFMLWIISVSIIIGICHNYCKNLFIPIWIHFMMNFAIVIVADELTYIFTLMAIIYFVVAIGYIIWFKKVGGNIKAKTNFA